MSKDVPRLLNSLPVHGKPFELLDIDLTLECNMRCVYCFKDGKKGSMSDRLAFDAMIWFIYASGESRDITVHFMGGEPLLRWQLIKRLVPFATRRAKEHGKYLSLGMTTNCSLVTDEIIEFAREWGIRFHASIDGIEEVQNRCRPFASGQPSFPAVKCGAEKLLAYNPKITARGTVFCFRLKRAVKEFDSLDKYIAITDNLVTLWSPVTFIPKRLNGFPGLNSGRNTSWTVF